MSEQAPAPSSPPEANPGVLLTSSKGGGETDLVKVGLLGGAAALVMLGMKKRGKGEKKEKSEAKAIESKSAPAEVIFSKDFESVSIGTTWRSDVLEPYLEDAAEERTLATSEWEGGDNIDVGVPMVAANVRVYMDHTREAVVQAFYKTHTAKTPQGEMEFAELPDTDATTHFKRQVESWVQQFQETF